MATIGKLVVSLGLNSAALRTGLTKSRKSLKSWVGGAVKMGAKVAGVFAGLTAIIGGGLLIAINKNAAAIDKITKAAGRLDFNIEEYQKLSFIAAKSNIEMEGFGKSMQRMLKTVGDARDGLSTATKAFDQLGLSADSLAQLSPSEQFSLIAERMKEIPAQADKVKIAMDIFGRSGADLLNVFQGDIKGIGDEFESLGITITQSQANAVAAYQDAKTSLSTLLGGFGRNLTAEVAPAFTLIVEKITNSIKAMGGMKSAAEKFAKFIIRGMILATEAIAGTITAVQELILTLKKAQLMYMIMDNLAGKLVPFGEDYSPAQMQKVANDILSMEKRIAEGSGVKQSVIDFMNSLQDAVESNSVSKINDMKLPDGSRDFNGIVAAMDAANETADAHKKLAASANETAEMLNKVTTSKAWQDIFGKADVTARANQFDTYAKLAKSNIESGSAFAGDNINTLKSILETATNNGGNGFSNNNLFEKLDLTGMADVIRGLESMASSNQQAVTAQQKPTSKISIDLTSDTGRVAGEIWGEAEFIRGIEEWNKQYMNDRARATAQ